MWHPWAPGDDKEDEGEQDHDEHGIAMVSLMGCDSEASTAEVREVLYSQCVMCPEENLKVTTPEEEARWPSGYCGVKERRDNGRHED